MEYEVLLELVRKRRSTRRFKADPVPDEYVDKIIEVARWAPSGANSQPWEFIVIRAPDIRGSIIELLLERHQRLQESSGGKMKPFHHGPPGYTQAPVFILLCGDTRTREAYPQPVVAEERFRSAFISSLAGTFLYMHLAAATLGLATQWVSSIASVEVEPQVRQLLGIPKELEIYDMLALGYSDVVPQPRLVRNSAEMVHHEVYNHALFRTEEQMEDFAADLSRDN